MQKHLKDYFIPHEGNDFKPHSLQKFAMGGMFGLVLLSFALANVQSLVWMSSQWMVSSVLPAVIVELTNEERDDSSLSTLKRSAVLDAAAKLKAQDMAKNEYFAHFSPTGVTPWHWFGEVNYNFVHAGENLAIHFTDSGEVVEAWMDSPTHRANIMNGNFTEIGVGTAEGTYDGFDTIYVVQLFGTPAATPAVASASESTPEPVIVNEPEPTQVAVVTPEPAADESVDVLSESVELTEDVEIVAAEPEPTTVQTPVEETTPATVEENASNTEVANMEVTENGVVMYSDFVSTSTGGVPATIEPDAGQTAGSTSFFLRVATQPQVVLQLLYAMIGLFVVASLLLSILIEIRRQQPLQIAYGVALLLLMYGLFELHSLVNGSVIVV